MQHYSVLSKETISRLKIKKNGIYIDCTLGLGGHTRLLAKEASEGKVISFDQDHQAMAKAKENLSELKNITFITDNFKNIKERLNELGIEKVDGILYDLGTSYYQLTDEDRGFTYHGKSKLDMRMNQEQELSAIEVVNDYNKEKLVEVLYKYGDEPKANKIADAIISYRENNKKIEFNTELNDIIKSVKGYGKEKHPSKNIFQAIRIEVNDEINVIKSSIEQAISMIDKGGIIAVITFHSLEDKTIKNIFWNHKNKIDVTEMGNIHYFKTSKTVYPSKDEVDKNKASRSAKLRTLTKIKN